MLICYLCIDKINKKIKNIEKIEAGTHYDEEGYIQCDCCGTFYPYENEENFDIYDVVLEE